MKKRVIGIGGLFFKSDNPKASKEWYKKHLGFNTDDFGATFWWKDKNGKDASTQWSPFEKNQPILSLQKKILCLITELKIWYLFCLNLKKKVLLLLGKYKNSNMVNLVGF